MAYRGFLLLADDGKVQLGTPETPDVNEFEREYPELRKEPYGAKAKSAVEMYAKYVPPEYVPDRFDIPSRDSSARPTSVQLKIVSGTGAASHQATKTSTQASQRARSGSGAGPARKVRWSDPAHSAALANALLGPPFNGSLPRKLDGWTELVA